MKLHICFFIQFPYESQRITDSDSVFQHIYLFVFTTNVRFSDLTPNNLILCQLGVSVMHVLYPGVEVLAATCGGRRQTLRFCLIESGC